MNESYFRYEAAHCFMRHNTLLPKRKTLLFLHGLGDSSISYFAFFSAFQQFNILVPDLLGHGKSSNNTDYQFKLQTGAIIAHIEALEKKLTISLENIILIAHSMGNFHAQLLCHSILKNKIIGMINIEGNVTEKGSFVSEAAALAFSQNNFKQWFIDFKETSIFEKCTKAPFYRSYYASLKFCVPEAFLQNALEIRGSCHFAGKNFMELNVAKVYCYSKESLSKESICFLEENHIPTKTFPAHSHFLMLECFGAFVEFVMEWIS